jgi:UDP-N-acetylmuramoyl-tripeptide--D-alanyl-D-alanine ligase
MCAFDPKLVASWTAGAWAGSPPAAGLTGFAIDSRVVRPGEMFVAIRTDQRDGHDYLSAAASAGAAAALVSAPRPGVDFPQLVVPDALAAFQAIAREHRRRFPGVVIGVTGSAGKTSTKELLARLLGEATLATEGNLNNHLGVPLTLVRMDPALHRFAVIEAGISAPGEMRVLADMIEPDAAVVTLVGPAHLLELGGLDGVAREKAVLAQKVRPGGVAVFPPSCRAYAPFRAVQTHLPPWGVITQPEGEAVKIWLNGDRSTAPFILPVASEGMAQNAALALLIALHFGVPEPELRRRLAEWRPTALRGEVRRDGGRLMYLDYYNANPVSMRDALAAFERLAPRPQARLFILGCMEELGAGAARYHRELGNQLPLGPQDKVFVVGDWAHAVRDGAIERGASPSQIITGQAAAEARALVEDFAGPTFVKGSRKHRLEGALASPARTAAPVSC